MMSFLIMGVLLVLLWWFGDVLLLLTLRVLAFWGCLVFSFWASGQLLEAIEPLVTPPTIPFIRAVGFGVLFLVCSAVVRPWVGRGAARARPGWGAVVWDILRGLPVAVAIGAFFLAGLSLVVDPAVRVPWGTIGLVVAILVAAVDLLLPCGLNALPARESKEGESR